MHQTDIDKILKYKDSPLSFSQISKEDFEKVKNRPGIKEIGVVTDKPGKGVFLKQEGHLELLEVHGYDHFEK